MINLYSVGSKIRVCLLVSLCCFLILSEVIAKPPAELGPKLRQRLGEKLGNFNPSADDVKGIKKLDLRNLGDDRQLATLGGINQFDGLCFRILIGRLGSLHRHPARQPVASTG